MSARDLGQRTGSACSLLSALDRAVEDNAPGPDGTYFSYRTITDDDRLRAGRRARVRVSVGALVLRDAPSPSFSSRGCHCQAGGRTHLDRLHPVLAEVCGQGKGRDAV